jgi:hypothetical protein
MKNEENMSQIMSEKTRKKKRKNFWSSRKVKSSEMAKMMTLLILGIFINSGKTGILFFIVVLVYF